MKPGMPTAVHVSRGASYLVIQTIFANAVTIVAFAVLARIITPKEMGIWAVLMLINGILQNVGALALPSAAIKFIAENVSRNNMEGASSAFYQSLRLTLVSAILIALPVFIFAPDLATRLLGDPSYGQLFRVLAIDIVVSTGALQVLGGVLLGFQKFKETAAIGIAVNSIFRQVLIVTLIIWMRNFVGLVIGWAVSDFVSALAYFVFAYRLLGRPIFNFPVRKLIGFSWPLSVSNVAGFAQSWFDRALLIAYVPLAILGIYNSALVAFGALVSVIGAMSTPLFPAYSAVQTSDDKQALGNAAKLATRYSSLIGVPLAFGLLATAKPALTLFVGQAYIEGTVPLIILCGIYALSIVGTIALPPVLLALGATKLLSAIDIVTIIVSLGVGLVLLPVSGMIGAAVTHGLAIALAAGLTIVALRGRMTLPIDYQALVKSLLAGGNDGFARDRIPIRGVPSLAPAGLRSIRRSRVLPNASNP